MNAVTFETIARVESTPVTSGQPSVDAMVVRALAAQRQLERWDEAHIDALLFALSDAVADQAHSLAVAAVEETGMGNVRDKAVKNVVASEGIYAQLAGKVGFGEIGFDAGRGIAEIACPVGVVAGLVPAVHPVATFIFKVLIALKGRNAIILSPSRRAQRVSRRVGVLLRTVLRESGAPADAVQWIEDGSREAVAALMNHKDIGLVLATGGRAMVEAAYRSGKPAIGVGPGNAPALVAADADIPFVAQSVVQSKSFDNGLICGAENHLVVEASVRARLIAELERCGAAVLSKAEAARFRDAAVNPETHRFLPPVVGQDAATLAALAHIERPGPIALLVVPTSNVDAGNYLAAEKVAPVVSLFTVANAEGGSSVCRRLLEIDGAGHTAIIHTRNAGLVARFSAAMRASRILVNSPATQALMGLTTALTPSLTLGCGTWGGCSTTSSVTYRDLLNIKRVVHDGLGHGLETLS